MMALTVWQRAEAIRANLDGGKLPYAEQVARQRENDAHKRAIIREYAAARGWTRARHAAFSLECLAEGRIRRSRALYSLTPVQAVDGLLAGQHPAVIGAALADLTAMWIAGHVAIGDEAATARARAGLLAKHVELVLLLVPINAAISGTKLAAMQEAGRA
jgi:hypothetical protein